MTAKSGREVALISGRVVVILSGKISCTVGFVYYYSERSTVELAAKAI